MRSVLLRLGLEDFEPGLAFFVAVHTYLHSFGIVVSVSSAEVSSVWLVAAYIAIA